LPWHQRAIGKLLFCAAMGMVAAVLAAATCPVDFWISGLVGWDVGATVLLTSYLVIICSSDAERSRQRAASWDPGRHVVSLLISTGCLFSFGASLVLIGERHSGISTSLLMGLCLWAVLSSWFLTHSSYTLRYAHLYYRGDDAGGLDFPGGQAPDDLDFAYHSFTIGMTFQVSDVLISNRLIRRYTLLHSVISFFYNTAILALALNLIFGHIGSLN
jgi:uncharacterized membrane protein